jgi:hypothetical protein
VPARQEVAAPLVRQLACRTRLVTPYRTKRCPPQGDSLCRLAERRLLLACAPPAELVHDGLFWLTGKATHGRPHSQPPRHDWLVELAAVMSAADVHAAPSCFKRSGRGIAGAKSVPAQS